ncbi:hypothetical protein TGVAND_437860 [Toxoplasma gondii VAND]|uniref:Uncharacterized protein n=1 Tax=Toxoplasma gondii VAND TaxID=933077 RepID=A0A086PPD5_TOXGO|nr:hypothetical protein TGVAND_437860 [Toxoplasma gondii VAND]
MIDCVVGGWETCFFGNQVDGRIRGLGLLPRAHEVSTLRQSCVSASSVRVLGSLCERRLLSEIQDSASASPAKAKEEPRGEAAAEEIEEEKTLGRKHDGESRAFPGKGNSENGSARNATVCPLWRRFSFEVFVAVVEEIMQEPRRSVCACLALLSRFTAAGRSSSWRECPQKPTKETEKRLQERSNSQAESDGDTKKAEEAFVQHALHVVWSTGEAVIAALNAEDAGGCKAQVAFVLDCLRAGESRS